MEINLTDLELQALAMMCWMKERFVPKKASDYVPGFKTLVKFGFVEEMQEVVGVSPNYSTNALPTYNIRVTGEGLKWFRNLDPIIKIRAYVRCGLYFEAKALIMELLPEQLPEFLAHGNRFVREATQLSMGIYGYNWETVT